MKSYGSGLKSRLPQRNGRSFLKEGARLFARLKQALSRQSAAFGRGFSFFSPEKGGSLAPRLRDLNGPYAPLPVGAALIVPPGLRVGFEAYEPAGLDRRVAPVVRPRKILSDADRSEWRATVISVALHGLVIALVLLLPHGPKMGDEVSAPTFAVQFDSGAAPPSTEPVTHSEPRVNLSDDSEAPPPPPQTASPDAEQYPPPLRYGSALRPRTNNNPFAHVTQFDLSPNRSRSPTALPPGSRGLDLAAGPVITGGKLQDAVTHVRGAHGYDDYAEEIRAFAEAHKYYPQQAAENGEEGVATLSITVRRDGSIKHLQWVGHSGSALLDAAWFSVFHDNKLPPMNDDMPGDEYTFTFALDYYLIYGHPR